MTRAEALDEGDGGGVFWSTAPQKVRVQRRVRQLQNRLEAGNIGVAEVFALGVDEGSQHGIELPHPAAASPLEPSEARIHRGTPVSYSRRSASIFLISAIALPGFRSFGHACVQFKIVWQRYSRNASSS